VEDTAAEVRQDAEAAKKAASGAEQARADIDTALSATLKTANRLSELADEGEEAQQESRANLGLKSAATMTPQSDIRDRTEGRLATPGAFGFGHIFLPAERIRFNTEDDFLSWVRNATPGEYFVEGDSKIISGGVLFNGMVRIRWVEARNNPPEPRYTAKAIIFYGINGDVYYNRYWTTGNGYLTGWENLKITSQDIISLLSGIAPGTTDGWYGAGSLVLAAYNGKGDADTDRRIKRGYSYPGSRLSAVEFMCYGTTGSGVGYNGSVSVYVRGSGGGMPGSYRALSGDELGSAGSASVMIGLFIRIA
ncbi:phage tail protein, partial [Escherichia coli]